MNVPLPVWVLIVIICAFVSIIVLCKELVRHRATPALWYVSGAIFLRLLFAALHELTYNPVVGPLSIIALLSVATVIAGFFVIDRRFLLVKRLWPVYCMIALISLSACINGTLSASVAPLTKWLLLLVLVAALIQAQLETSFNAVTSVLLKAYLLPISLQCIALAVGHAKTAELDGSISYVGGYNHEGAFSVILATALFLSLLRYWHGREILTGVRRLIPLALFALMTATNYRTTILPMLLPTAIYCIHNFFWRNTGSAKIVFLSLVGGLTVILLNADLSSIFDRLADIKLVLVNADNLIQAPAYYTDWQRNYFSGRVYLWSQYITGWTDAAPLNQVIGMGPGSWEAVFAKYAHNTFISLLYELGILGPTMLAVFFAHLLISARHSAMLLAGIIGFIGVNLGTMPLWGIEGIILMSILSALAIFQSLEQACGRATSSGSNIAANKAWGHV